MLPYRPAAALCARVSTSVWPFHLPAVTVDLGHYLESGVRLSVCVCGVCVCDCTRAASLDILILMKI